MATNDFTPFLDVFEGIAPFRGDVEPGYLIDFLGGKIDANFRTIWGIDPAETGGCYTETELPDAPRSDHWFEHMNWIEAAC